MEPKRFYHASGDHNLTLERIDFERNGGNDYPFGLAVTQEGFFEEREWSQRPFLYELIASGKVLDLRNRKTALEVISEEKSEEAPYGIARAIERIVRRDGISIVYLNDIVQVITNKDSIQSFRVVRSRF